ncbi:hypothetical protein D9M68_697280 [compost metagenome]
MSIFMHATIKVDPYRLQDFLDVLLNKLVPILEERGWKLHGSFVQRYGAVRPAVVIDIWEMQGMEHVESVMSGDFYRKDPRYIEAMEVLKPAVISEELIFMEKRGGSMPSFF